MTSEIFGQRKFTTLPSRACCDTGLSALDLRCLAVISLYDGMSSARGRGAGCYARHDTLARTVGTDATNFSKALARLIERGYVVREQQAQDRRRSTLRVQFDPADSCPDDQPYSEATAQTWRKDQVTAAGSEDDIGGGVIDATDPASGEQIVDAGANDTEEMVGPGDSGNGSFSGATARDYISLNEKLDPDKSACGKDLVSRHVAPSRPSTSLRAHLPPNFDALPSGARVSKLEKAFNRVGRDPSAISATDRLEFVRDLYAIAEAKMGTPAGEQAQRLFEEMSYG